MEFDTKYGHASCSIAISQLQAGIEKLSGNVI